MSIIILRNTHNNNKLSNMLKSITLSLLFVAVSSKAEAYHGSSYLHTIEDPVWPPVHVAYNFKADF